MLQRWYGRYVSQVVAKKVVCLVKYRYCSPMLVMGDALHEEWRDALYWQVHVCTVVG
jgi:hypothetical protein